MLENSRDTVILLPSYQPEKTLIVLSKALSGHGFTVLIVDDGSGDDFKYIFDECSGWSTVVSYPINKGKGEALKVGFSYIVDNFKNTKYVITADGDGQHRIQDILKINEKIIEKNIAIIGERKFDVKVPLKSKLGNGLSRFTQALCTYRYMHDNQCGLRAFPISLLPKLIQIGGARYEYEMKVLNYLQISETPFQGVYIQTIYEEGNKTSHFKPVKDTLLIQGSIFMSGLLNFLSYLIGLTAAILFYELVFKNGGLYPIPVSYEVATIIASPIALIFQILLTLFVFKPKVISKCVFRLILFHIIMLISEIITVSLFSRVCGFPIWASYILCLPLVAIPIYYLIKGIGLVYNSQVE
ncbi:MAG: glycosyltransferase family 2 protein [Bacilli bacterium]|nr:glycosyltransferase family 2 protein [Bacilli bacterium]